MFGRPEINFALTRRLHPLHPSNSRRTYLSSPMFENIVINGFMFCEPHGSEYCHSCFCDHRMCNNTRIEDKLAQAFPGISEEQLLVGYIVKTNEQ